MPESLTCEEHALLYTPDPPECLPPSTTTQTVPVDVPLADTGTADPLGALLVAGAVLITAGLVALNVWRGRS